jgi:hypothetical protein
LLSFGAESFVFQFAIQKYKDPYTGLGRPAGFQEVEAVRFLDSHHMKVKRLSALCSGSLYPDEIFLVLFSGRG